MDRLRLWNAARVGNAAFVETCLLQGDDIEQLGGAYQDSTPLMIACRMGNCACIAVLIQRKQNLEHRDIYGYTALHLLVNANYSECASNFTESSSIKYRDRLVSLMLDEGADMYSCDNEGDNVMASAVHNNLCSVVEKMVARYQSSGKNPFGAFALNVKTGDTAMHAAVFARHYHNFDMSMVYMLLEMGADVDTRNKWGKTAFMSAVDFAEKRGNNHVHLMHVLLM
jgi:ankyrin repeat protein